MGKGIRVYPTKDIPSGSVVFKAKRGKYPEKKKKKEKKRKRYRKDMFQV